MAEQLEPEMNGVDPGLLTVELVPEHCEARLPELRRQDCEQLRKTLLAESEFHCQGCGALASRKHMHHCQEIWHYDDDELVQRLERIVVMCSACRGVKNIDAWDLHRLDLDSGHLAHLAKVRGWDEDTLRSHLEEALTRWNERSGQRWRLDLTALRTYGIALPGTQRRLAGAPVPFQQQAPPAVSKRAQAVACLLKLLSSLSPRQFTDWLEQYCRYLLSRCRRRLRPY